MSQWISIKDKLPDYHRPILLYPYWITGWRDQCIGDPPWIFVSHYAKEINPTHWMPLPKPPEESK